MKQHHVTLISTFALLVATVTSASCASAPPGVLAPSATLVGDFNGPTITGAYGHWSITTDHEAGGNSIASIQLVKGGPNGSAGALEITGEVKSGFRWGPWAGAIFLPGKTDKDKTDMSAYHEIIFWTKGDGGNFQVRLNSDNDMIPASQSFTAGPQWTEVHISLSAFGKDMKRVNWIAFDAGKKGPFRFEIADVRIQ